MITTTIALTALTMGAVTPDAPARLITQHGIELRADEQVFLLFAALNAAGYSEETNRKGPPLRAPVFHDIRSDVRDELRKAREQPSMDEVRKLFESNPGEIEDYLAAILSDGKKDGLSKPAAALVGKVEPVLTKFYAEAKVGGLFDTVATAQRDHAKTLKAALEKDFAEARKLLGDDTLRAPTDLVVVPNPLDGHAMVRELKIGKKTFLVVGPGAETARAAVLHAALLPAFRDMADKAWGFAAGYRRSWDALKTSRRISEQYGDGKNYLAEALTRAVAHRVGTLVDKPKDARGADEDFIDEQARQGMRWARVGLKVIDRSDASKPLSEELPGLVKKVGP